MSAVVFILLYGLSYGLVLCRIALGLVVTMGLMRVINLAHGAFAAIGGYMAISLMQQQGWPYALALPAAVPITCKGPASSSVSASRPTR